MLEAVQGPSRALSGRIAPDGSRRRWRRTGSRRCRRFVGPLRTRDRSGSGASPGCPNGRRQSRGSSLFHVGETVRETSGSHRRKGLSVPGICRLRDPKIRRTPHRRTQTEGGGGARRKGEEGSAVNSARVPLETDACRLDRNYCHSPSTRVGSAGRDPT